MRLLIERKREARGKKGTEEWERNLRRKKVCVCMCIIDRGIKQDIEGKEENYEF